jgi:hypothetical protein
LFSGELDNGHCEVRLPVEKGLATFLASCVRVYALIASSHFDPEDGGSMFLLSGDMPIHDYTVPKRRIPQL